MAIFKFKLRDWNIIFSFRFIGFEGVEEDNSFKTSVNRKMFSNCNNKRIEKFNLIPFANYHRSECRVVTKNPSGWTIGGETLYPTIPRKPTGSLIAQRNLPTFPRNPRKETKAKIEERTTFPLPALFPTSPKDLRFFHFFSSFYSLLYTLLPFWGRYFYVCSHPWEHL